MTLNATLNRPEFMDEYEAHIWAQRNANESCHPFQYWRVELDAELRRFYVAVYSRNTNRRQGYAQ